MIAVLEKADFCSVDGGKVAFYIDNQQSKGVPIMVIHGGPGTPHGYLRTLSSMLTDHPVIYYDQLDCGLSDKPNRSENWTLERSVEEIGHLQRHLGLDQFYLYAHSAGTMIGLDFALKYPNALKGLILASPVISMAHYKVGIDSLLMKLPREIKTRLINYSQGVFVDRFDLMEANAYFAERHQCRLTVWPDALFESSIMTNVSLRNYLWGESDIRVSGTLCDYERLERLSKCFVKSLLTCGEHDFIVPSSCEHYASHLPRARVEIINNASHHAHIEAPEHYQSILQHFLINAE